MTFLVRNMVMFFCMVVAAGTSVAVRPRHLIADDGPKLNLEAMVSTAFGDWQEEQQKILQIVDPQQKEMLDKIYKQTLSRTYVDHSGYRVMLSIAYGSNQSDSLQLHKPEVCYPAQGFALESKAAGILAVGDGVIPVIRINTSLGQRNEPVTYWTTIGDRVVAPGDINKKIAEIGYGLTGKIPDGMLVRISSIDGSADHAYRQQERFAAQMVESLSPEFRRRFAGVPQSK